MTYTYAELEVSRATYEEIQTKLIAAGYHPDGEDGAIYMHGIALIRGPERKRAVALNETEAP